MTGFSISYPATVNLAQPKSNKVSFLGHSFQAAGFGAEGSQYFTAYPALLCAMAMQRVRTSQALNFAVSGQTSTQIIARVPAVLAAQPAACIIDMITNDTALAASETLGNVAYVVNAMRGAGIIPIIVLWSGRGGASAITTAQYRKACYINEQIKATYALVQGVYVVDASPNFVDSTTGAPLTGLSPDGLHPYGAGAYVYAAALLPVINAIWPVAPGHFGNALDTYSPTDNPQGNLHPNPMMMGTSGALSGSVTGQLANGLTGKDASSGGATMALSKGSMADGRPCQVATIGGTYSGSNRYFEIALSASIHANLSAGDKIEGILDVEIGGGNQNFSYAQLFCNILAPGGSTFIGCGNANPNYQHTTQAIALRLRSDPAYAVIPSGGAPTFADQVLRLGLVNQAASSPASAVIKFTSASIRKR